eukprot:gene18782-25322_t
MNARVCNMHGGVRLGHSSASSHRGLIRCFGIKENVAKLPPTDGIKCIRVIGSGAVEKSAIVPMPGKMASVSIYGYLADKYNGVLGAEAVAEALELYSEEVVADAVARPGAHPNIDILLEAQKSDGEAMRVEVTRE